MMWQAVTDAVGVAGRDALWDYPDLMPTADDIDDPAALIQRLQASMRGETPAVDEFDEALARLLDGDDFSGSAETSESDAAERADAAEGADAASDAGATDDRTQHDDDDPQGGERPV